MERGSNRRGRIKQEGTQRGGGLRAVQEEVSPQKKGGGRQVT